MNTWEVYVLELIYIITRDINRSKAELQKINFDWVGLDFYLRVEPN